jgi:hypothetical protein
MIKGGISDIVKITSATSSCSTLNRSDDTMTPFQTGDGLFGRVAWRYDWALEYFHQAIILRTSGEQDTVSIVRSLQTGRFEDTMNTRSEELVGVDLHRIAKVDYRVTWLRLYPSPILLFDREALNWDFGIRYLQATNPCEENGNGLSIFVRWESFRTGWFIRWIASVSKDASEIA